MDASDTIDCAGAIAVVIRCHDQGRFLTEAVRSVNEQTRQPSLIVLVDDGSSDDTAALAESLAANPVPVLVVSRHPARGPVASLNDGIRAAGAVELILPLDADDRLSPRFVELTAAALRDEPTADLAYGAVHEFGAGSAVRPARRFELDELMVENVAPVTSLVRRRVFDELGPFDSRFDSLGLEDWEYWVRMAAAGRRGVPVTGCWLEYRRHAEASRNDVGRRRGLTVRAAVWWKHRRVLRPRHVIRWITRPRD